MDPWILVGSKSDHNLTSFVFNNNCFHRDYSLSSLPTTSQVRQLSVGDESMDTLRAGKLT